MPLRGASLVVSIVVLSCVKTTALVHDVRRQLSEDGAQVGADFFQENVFIEDGSAQQQLATIKDEEPEPAPDQTVAIWITWPTNDTVFTLGDVVLAFETRGFPSGEIPIEVLIPQHGDKPTLLMEKSNTITVSVSRPCTQLVTIFATARGQRVSTSVLFSMIQDKAAIVSARAPLPADASWGPRSDAVSSLLREPDTDKNNSQILENRAGLLMSPRHDNTDVSTEGTPSPISVVFLGSLYFDGQKHIWLHQMERLSRARFAPKYLTFHEEEGDVGGKSDAEEARFREADDVEIFKRRLRNADVPLVRASLPRMDAGWIAENIDEKTTDNVRMDIGFGVVLESLDSAGGDPHLMSHPWAREVFLVIADAIKRASPDVLVVPNSVTLGDVVITKAARWAMGSRGLKIIMDFPNLQPTHGVDVDLFATPSHYVARHPDVEALAKSTTTPVVVIPPGTEVASAVVLTEEKDVSEHNRSGGPLHDDLACGSDVLKDLGCRDPDCHVVGFAGRLVPRKGPGLFLAVAEALAKLVPCAVFVVAGDGHLRLALEAMAERLGLARRVRFTGWVEGADLERLLAGMSILFNPSLAISETFSVINIQAMSVGTPVAAFGTGGMLEYLSPNVNALVLDEAEPSKVAAEVAELLLDRPRLDALAERGKADVLSNFRVDTAVERWAELYESLLGRGRWAGMPGRAS